MMINPTIKITATSLAGCLVCHMSFLNEGERLVNLLEHFKLGLLLFTNIKHCCPCDIGLIEDGVCNAESTLVLAAPLHL